MPGSSGFDRGRLAQDLGQGPKIPETPWTSDPGPRKNHLKCSVAGTPPEYVGVHAVEHDVPLRQPPRGAVGIDE